MGRDGGTEIGHCYPPRMPNLTIRVGDLNFTARWEPEAPRTVEAVRRLLPMRRQLIHCRWSGEGTWIPLGDVQTGVGYEHHTSHPAPGELLIYTGDLSEWRDPLPLRGLLVLLEAGPAGRQPLRHASSPMTAGATSCARWAGACCGMARRRSRSGRPADMGREWVVVLIVALDRGARRR